MFANKEITGLPNDLTAIVCGYTGISKKQTRNLMKWVMTEINLVGNLLHRDDRFPNYKDPSSENYFTNSLHLNEIKYAVRGDTECMYKKAQMLYIHANRFLMKMKRKKNDAKFANLVNLCEVRQIIHSALG